MKKLNLLILIVLAVGAFSCKKKTDEIPPASDAIVLSGNLTTQTLVATEKYLLKGQVFVQAGQVLTIQPGTVIKGDKASKAALIVNVGGKIIANGTACNPIVFTSAQEVGSRDEGDWAGVLILGDATTNQTSPTIEGISPAVTYGGTDNTDNSGSMKYCRIEFAGIALTPNNETNSLTLGGVGSGTTLEYIQTSFGGDDAYEFFGGTVNANHLVSLSTWDDDFDTDFGFSGNVQFAVAIRDPFQADQSGSCAFESDNEATGTVGPTPITSGVFSNVTVLGPIFDSTKAISGNYTRAAHIRRNTNLSIYNSVLVGFPTSIFVEGAAAQGHYPYTGNVATPTGAIKGNMIINLQKYDKTKSTTLYGDATSGLIWNTSSANDAPVVVTSTALFGAALTTAGLSTSMQVGFSPYNSNPDFSVSSGTLTSGFVTVPSGLSTVSYRGAFDATDWTDCWGQFDPKNAIY